MDQQSINILSTMDHKSIKHRKKSMSGGLRRRFGSIVGHFGPSRTFLLASWTVLEASWRSLGGLLGRHRPRQVANMVPSWPPKRSQNLFKIDPKIDKFVDASWNRSFTIFQRFWEPKTEPCWIAKMYSKIDPILKLRKSEKFYETTIRWWLRAREVHFQSLSRSLWAVPE